MYQQIPDAQDILKRHGKLNGLVTKCPYLSMSGGAHGGTYLIKLDKVKLCDCDECVDIYTILSV